MRKTFTLALFLLTTACTTVEIGGINAIKRHIFFPWEVRHISPEGSTSQCLGDFTDPICALETLIACRVAGQKFLGCYGNEYDDDERRIKRGNPYTEYVIVRSSYLYEAGIQKYQELYDDAEPVDDEATPEDYLNSDNDYRHMLCLVYFGRNCDYDITFKNQAEESAKRDKRMHQSWILVKYNQDGKVSWEPYDIIYTTHNLNNINIWHILKVNTSHNGDYWLGE